jgi:RHS repeat-associated protein
VEYFPFGETWVEEHSNRQRTPYLFTGKELDEDTGLYYFGARYYDPRTSVWQSPDPILASYMQGKRSGEGVYTPPNLNLYAYVHQKPVIGIDPNGMECWFCMGEVVQNTDGSVTIRSTNFLRYTVPGQVAWDNARTSYANGDTRGAVIGTGAMVVEQLLVVGTMGLGTTATTGARVTTAVATPTATAAVTRGSSVALGNNMVRNGIARPAETAAHHIVAHGAKAADGARAVLTRFGIGVDDAVNGVFLPRNLASANPNGALVHSTIHTKAYYNWVNETLGSATTRNAVTSRLEYIKNTLLSGRTPWLD